jgi:hydrogenase maturation protein HypF
MKTAKRIRVRGVVQGVGFRPFVFRLAQRWNISGWVHNGASGVEIHAEGEPQDLAALLREMKTHPPAAAQVAEVLVEDVPVEGHATFYIRESRKEGRPVVRIPADLAVCSACLQELFDPGDRRYLYPYINCTDCGPRYTVIEALPYDRPRTTMKVWPMCPDCAAEYRNPADRRFHAQPVACPRCGPHYYLWTADMQVRGDAEALQRVVELLRHGAIVAIKGLGGYHLACDAENAHAVHTLRERKRRGKKPFAVMAKDIDVARELVHLTPEAETLLTSVMRPIVLVPARRRLEGVAPDNNDLGVMLPYTPLHYMLFASGAPQVLVMTSANRSSEPIVYQDDEAVERLRGIADAWLIGERPIARRVDDSVVRSGAFGPTVLRRGRGYAPLSVARLPSNRPVLALGADLKNTITLVVDGQAIMSQHVGDLDQYDSYMAFEQTVHDLLNMYDVPLKDTVIAHDLHPDFRSTCFARTLAAYDHVGIQHHRAHVAAVLAEKSALDRTVVGVAFDGTGFGDDGAIWGGEFFVGSAAKGLIRAGHLRYALLPGGDAASRVPVQALAGFLCEMPDLASDVAEGLQLPERFVAALQLAQRRVQSFPTTSAGRLFDSVAALLGFTDAISYEGEAAIWLEHVARHASLGLVYPFPWNGRELDYRPLLEAAVKDRLAGKDVSVIARSFHRGIAEGIHQAVLDLCQAHGVGTVVLSGGVLQNTLLLEDLRDLFSASSLEVWLGREVPPNDGGISLGQAALAVAACSHNGTVC